MFIRSVLIQFKLLVWMAEHFFQVLVYYWIIFQIKRYRTYAYMLRSRAPAPLTPPIIETAPAVRLAQNSIGEVDESAASPQGQVTIVEGNGGGLVPPPIPERRSSPVTNRYSYRQAIYSGSGELDWRSLVFGCGAGGFWV